ncbi:MAG: efflux RND transporter permease subunit [Eubacterium sp.]|nr:efflux RND transporter permease subunit [Eubacterium sp.]
MISKFSVKRPYTVFVVVVAVLVIGYVAMTKMTADLLPDMELPYVIVMTMDMGASPEEVEMNVTAPLEAGLATTANLKTLQSMSYNSYSVVIMEYEGSSNMDKTMIDIQQKLEQVKSTLPDGVGNPIIMQINPDMLPIMVAAVGVDGMDPVDVTDYVKNDIEPQLESVEGVASVTVSGGIEQKIQVTIDNDKVDKLNKEISDAIDSKFVKADKEIKDAKSEIQSGKNKVNAGKEKAAKELSEAETTLNTKKIELYQTESDLKEQLTTLQTTAETLKSAIDGLQKAYDGATAAEEGRAALTTAIDMYDQGLLDDTSFSAMTGMTIDEARAKVVELTAAIDQINASILEQAPLLATQGITVTSYKDLPAAIAQLSDSLTQVNAGIAGINSALSQIADGKITIDDAIKELGKGSILGTLEMSNAMAQLITGEAAIKNAETQMDDAKKSAKDQADIYNVLSVENLSAILMAQNFSMPAGYVASDEGQLLIKVGDKVEDAKSLENLVLVDLGMDGVDPIHLNDIANVEVIDNSADVYAKINGKTGILVTFEKQTGYATGDVTDSILERFDLLEREEDKHPEFSVLMNQGVYIDIIIKSIIQNILLGAILAIGVLIIFLRDVRPTIIIACAIPLSLVFAVVLMYFTGITLNIISMSGLALGIGMLVDNSIVVIENIFRLRSEGMSIKKASVYGASQVAGAIAASTLTTICVFAPIVFTEGLTRQLFVDMGLTIAYTLVASLLVALTLVPAMAQGMLKNVKPKERKESRFMDGYGKFLRGCMRFKPIVFIVLIALLAGSFVLAASRGTEFFPEMASTQVTVNMSAPEDEERTFEEMADMATVLSDRIQEIDGVETVGAMMGSGSLLGGLTSGGQSSSNNVTMYVLLKEGLRLSNDEIEKKIMKLSEDLDCVTTVSADMMDMSALTGNGISIKVKGNDQEKLKAIAADITEALGKVKGIDEIDDGLGDMASEVVISVDKDKAASYNMTVAQVFQLVMAELADTSSATSITTDIKSLDVYVASEDQSEVTIDDLKKLTFTYKKMNDEGETEEEEIPLTKIAKFVETEELSTIYRDSQTRFITVSGTLKEGYNIGLVGNDVRNAIKNVEIPEGYALEMSGEDQAINEAMEQVLLMLLLAVILIYLIMVAQFQSLLSPFIIMFTIPLAFTGGFLMLFITGKAISIIAMIGFVMLSGIIVNNGIVLIDYIIQLRREGMSKKDAIIESSKTRLRPVLMTALTTIISMSTMALGMGQGTEMSQPMAIVVVGGMVYGTLLTLIAVPCIYDAMNREKDMREENLDLDENDAKSFGAIVPEPALAGDSFAVPDRNMSGEGNNSTENIIGSPFMDRLRDIKENPVDDDPTYDTSLFDENNSNDIIDE